MIGFGWPCGPSTPGVESGADYTLRQGGVCGLSPLLFDLGGNGLQLSTLAEGTTFDLLGNGQLVRCAWSRGDDAWLTVDLNGNGRVDGATELFGNESFGREHSDGFSSLAELDANRDGRIDAKDPAFAQLRLWTDADRNGLSSSFELRTLSQAGIAAIEVAAVSTSSPWDGRGNRIPLVSRFIRTEGTSGLVGDAFLQYIR